MFGASDMIRAQVGEQSVIKGNACDPVQFQRLGRDFHHAEITSVLHHFGEEGFHVIGLRRCCFCLDELASGIGADGSDRSHFMTCFFQDRLKKAGDTGFSFRPGNADGRHLLCRLIKVFRAGLR